MAAAAGTEAGMDGRVSFDEFIQLLEQAGPAGPLEGPDPKVQAEYIVLRSVVTPNSLHEVRREGPT